MLPYIEDTIAAIATAPGDAGIGIIRISGAEAEVIADKIFSAKNKKKLTEQKNYTLSYGWILQGEQIMDEVLVSVMRGPHSFTGEDVVEINTHGGQLVIQTTLELVLKSGARMAQPGEFTQRAFINGRIDLTRAEGINDLIHAKTVRGMDQAVNQLRGKLYDKIKELQGHISWVLALVNANIDFPEEDIVFTNQDAVISRLSLVADELNKLINSANYGRIVREGLRVVLVGEPNVGKSSLMNALLQENRSIVTHLPGTTRDTIEEMLNIDGIPLAITDTAGIRKTENPIEQEGIERAYSAVEKADLILWVVDITNPSFNFTLPEAMRDSNVPVLMILNKSDLKNGSIKIPSEAEEVITRRFEMSAKNEDDIIKLRSEIIDFILTGITNVAEDVTITNQRQKIAAEKALEQVIRSSETVVGGFGEECLAIDLTDSLRSLGEIVGEVTTDDMLNSIFSNFCIGK